jgi:hypothetical protein
MAGSNRAARYFVIRECDVGRLDGGHTLARVAVETADAEQAR